jgi:two-component system, NtrC family, response regulator AtoC
MTPIKRILAVDDESSMRRLLEIGLKQAGYQTVLAANGKEALDIIRKNEVDLVVSDLHMPIMSGLQLLQSLQSESIETPVIIVTAQGEVESAVSAMKLGAKDYLLRPFDLETLELAIHRALSLKRLEVENTFLKNQESGKPLIGTSQPMLILKQTIEKLAPEKATVLIIGETGTGKEVVAQALHAASPRHQALFVAVNCAAIPADMLESELFGHERGAFTGAVKARVGKFELADGGTLFLDEITEMPIALQAKLLRAIQESKIERLGGNRTIEVDIRIIAASNRDPLEAIQAGKLREDLYYRLNVFSLALPALRHRKQDIALLVNHFLKLKPFQLSPETLSALQSYDWPGNVRELENVIERACIVCNGDTLLPQHLPNNMLTIADDQLTANANLHSLNVSSGSLSIPDAVAQIEKKLILAALEETKGNKSKAAKRLEISERSLWYKLDQYELR